MYHLGCWLDDQRHYAIAAECYYLAAKKGHVDAMRNLGIMYDIGEGVKKDHEKARKWYGEAARRGDPMAIVNLELLT